MPVRIQLKRTKGWRKPPGVVVVRRPTKWGNLFTVEGCLEAGFADTVERARVVCAEAFRSCVEFGDRSPWWFLDGADHFERIRADLEELRGKDVGCTCSLDGACHGDGLIYLANKEPLTPPAL